MVQEHGQTEHSVSVDFDEFELGKPINLDTQKPKTFIICIHLLLFDIIDTIKDKNTFHNGDLTLV